MKSFFKDLFEYHHFMNNKLFDLLLKNSDKISERSIFLFSHSVNAHQIWNARILKGQQSGVNDLHSIEECRTLDNENHKNTMKIIDDYDFLTKINYQNSKGDKFVNSIQEILFQVANHFTHHRGQIIANLRQNGIEPIITDYIYYKR